MTASTFIYPSIIDYLHSGFFYTYDMNYSYWIANLNGGKMIACETPHTLQHRSVHYKENDFVQDSSVFY